MRALARSSWFVATALVVSCLAGCSTPRPPPPDHTRAPNQYKPHLLYLLPSPHARLYVEVDAVEGCGPKDAALEKLRGFLSQYCAKPDGIDIVRSDVIPIKAARGIAPRALARTYINGPQDATAAPPAFMYVLYYDFGLSRNFQAENILHRGARTMPVRRRHNSKPYAETYLYPAIYFNTRFSFGMAMNEILLHETGHLLGLVDRQGDARSGHCLNRGCQMNTHLQYFRQFRWLPGRNQSALCTECVAELGDRATQPPLPNARYVGSVLVRAETDYHVLTLPDRLALVVGSLTDRDCAEFATAMRPEKPDPADDGRWFLYCIVKDDVLKEPAKLGAIATRFNDDPLYAVRRGGQKVFLDACSRRYRALGQNPDIVETLRPKILKPE
ncbi:MAG: hypothetical protein L0Y58_21520 [Verrucomicrobia subdivision 3 bacterium]|nr:hypothetical protein [Limisphaerales bacterium]